MIHVEPRGSITLVTIDRPERRNALDHDALAGLESALAAAHEGSSRVLVLTGAGGHFCSGADLSGVEDEGFVAALARVLQGLRSAPFVTMAIIDGFALGAGTQLAIACDLRIATATAGFGVPAAKLGLMVDQWTVRRLVALVGQSTARHVLLSTDVLTGQRAFDLGLVHRQGDLDEGLDWAGRIASLAPLTLQGLKIGLDEADPPEATSPAYAAAFDRAWSSEDLAEGLAAFGAKRTPEFRGR
ncbi:MAG: enoyl-CoA hydratase [Acidobacteria bacterium]|nr:enoyl-CoA hydratase [Acidobacteriota bacterium]